MSDLALQREARRQKLLKNAENRMNRLKSKESNTNDNNGDSSAKEDETGSDAISSDFSSNAHDNADDGPDSAETPTMNLRSRKIVLSPQSTSEPEQKRQTEPFDIVEDPEVPSLAEFLESQKKTAPPKFPKYLPPKTATSHELVAQREKLIERVKVLSVFVTAFLARLLVTSGLGSGSYLFGAMFQSIFFPFLAVQVLQFFLLHYHFQVSQAPPPQAFSMLTMALVLCGIQQNLLQSYLKLMAHISALSNDFFLYLFAFLAWHTVL